MTTMLIGATGFLGSTLAGRLANRDTVALARPSSDLSVLPRDMPVRFGDLSDPRTLPGAFDGIDTLIFSASMGAGQVPLLLRYMRETPARRGVFISTTAIFTRLPVRSRAPRLEAEEAVRQSGLAWTILRPTMIYGSARDRNISRLLRLLRVAPVFPVFGDGQALQQPVHVDDLAQAVLAALDADAAVGQAYDLSGAAPLTFEALVRTAGEAVGRETRLLYLPERLGYAAARLAGLLPGPRLLKAEQIARLAEDKAFEHAAAVRDLGFQPRSFAEGVRLEATLMGLAPRHTVPA